MAQSNRFTPRLPAKPLAAKHARAFLTSAGEAVSSIENHDPRLLLREFVVLFRIFAAHSATYPKCNEVSVADSNVAMPRMTAELFREILDSIEGDIETLEIEKTVSEGEDVPTQAERSAIERVQNSTQSQDMRSRTLIVWRWALSPIWPHY
jgi:hypothetical protein